MSKVIRLTEGDLVKLVKRVIAEQYSEKEEKQLDICFKKNSPYFSKIASVTGKQLNKGYGEGDFLGYNLHIDREFNRNQQDKGRIGLDINTDGCNKVDVVVEFGRMSYGGKYMIGDITKRFQDTIKSSGLPIKCTDHNPSDGGCKIFTYTGKPGDPNVFKVIDMYKKFII